MWRCQQTQQHEPFAKCDAPIWNDPVALVLLSEAKHPYWIDLTLFRLSPKHPSPLQGEGRRVATG